MLSARMGSQASLVLKETFAGWRELVGELEKDWELERLREEHLRFKMKTEEGARRMLSALMGSQGSLRLKEAFAGWRELLGERRQERELERLREENLRFKMKSEEGGRRMLSAWMGSQASLVLKETFAGWRELVG